MADIKIQNIVASTTIAEKLELDKIMESLPNTSYRPNIFPGLVLAVGLVPNGEIFKKLGVKMGEKGYIITDEEQQTNIEGIFAVGDIVRGSFRLLIVGAAHGAIASQKIYGHIKKPYWAEKKKGQ